jgi:hypothetical protein
MNRYYVHLAVAGDDSTIASVLRADERGRFNLDVATGPDPSGVCTLDVQLDAENPLEAAQAVLRVLAIDRDKVMNIRSRNGDEIDRELLEDQLLGVRELARELGVSPQRVSAMARKLGSFPTPWATLASGPVWRRAEVDRFVRAWPRKSGRPSNAAATVALGAIAGAGLVVLKGASKVAQS